MKIGELAKRAGVATSTIRYYEAEGLLAPATRTSNGYRHYDEGSLARVEFIQQAQTAGLRLVDINDVLAIRDSGQPPCHHVKDLLAQKRAEVDQQLAELERLRATLESLEKRASGPEPSSATEGICWILEGSPRRVDVPT